MDTVSAVAASQSSRRWWSLATVTVAMFMIMLDNTIVTVALPAIQFGINASISQLEWVISAYALAFAVFLLPGGKLADFLGRRKIFAIGLVIFTGASLWCGFASSAGELITARSVQGLGGAIMLPATVAIISETFAPHERGMAFGIWSGISAGALAIGPLVGGLLVDYVHWTWIFFINVPVGGIGLVATFLIIQESRDTSADQSLDLLGLASAGAALFLLIFGLIETNSRGWGAGLVIGCFVGAAVLLAAFVVVERRGRRPMLDLTLFRVPSFVGANSVGLLVMCALFGFIFFLSIYLQSVREYTPIQTGAIFLFSTVALMLTAPIGGRLADRVGSRLPIVLGMALFGGTLIVMSRLITRDVHVWTLFPWIFVGGVGYGLVMAPVTTTVVAAVPPAKSGVASALMQSMRQLGGALGVAVAGAIIATYTNGKPLFTHEYGVAYSNGLRSVMLFAGVTALLGAAIGFVLIRRQQAAAVEADAGAVAVAPPH